MRLILSLLIIMLIVAACGGNAQEATAEVTDPTSDPADIPPTDSGEDENSNIIFVTPESQQAENALPLPGTLTHDEGYEAEDNNAPFDQITFIRSGGSQDSPTYLLVLHQDGSYELNKDINGKVDADVVKRINDILHDLNYFAINTPMIGTVPSNDYQYTITVTRGSEELMIRAEDKLAPQEFKRLLGAMMGVIMDSDNTALAPADAGA